MVLKYDPSGDASSRGRVHDTAQSKQQACIRDEGVLPECVTIKPSVGGHQHAGIRMRHDQEGHGALPLVRKCRVLYSTRWVPHSAIATYRSLGKSDAPLGQSKSGRLGIIRVDVGFPSLVTPKPPGLFRWDSASPDSPQPDKRLQVIVPWYVPLPCLHRSAHGKPSESSLSKQYLI